jgi:hypothetical protein
MKLPKRFRRTKQKRQEFFGEVFRIPPKEGGALAQCSYCPWSRWFPDRARKQWNSVDRGFAALQGHVRTVHKKEKSVAHRFGIDGDVPF